MYTTEQSCEQGDSPPFTDRPPALAVQPQNIPEVLQAIPNWVCWRYVDRGAKWTKVPHRCGGQSASTADPATWTTFERVANAYTNGGFDGVGFMLDGAPVTPHGLVIAGVDLDHVTDSQATRDRARHLIGEFRSYAEWFPSGRGIRIFCLAAPLRTGVNRDGVELYTSGRYLTVTGHRLEADDV